MVDGIIVLQWTDREGMVISAEYPKGVATKLSQRTLLQIYHMHQYGDEAGIASLTIDDVNFASYSLGPDSRHFVTIVLNLLENHDDYEKSLEKISRKIITTLEDDVYIKMLPTLLDELSKIE